MVQQVVWSERGCNRFTRASCQENLNTFKRKCVSIKWRSRWEIGGSDQGTQNLSDDVLRFKVGKGLQEISRLGQQNRSIYEKI